MISALSVLGLVIDRGTLHLHLAAAKESLEVLHVVVCIPQTPFHVGEYLNGLLFGTLVGEGQLRLAGVDRLGGIPLVLGGILLPELVVIEKF